MHCSNILKLGKEGGQSCILKFWENIVIEVKTYGEKV